MSNNYFQFKKFTIVQDGCAMKVGTDGCLLGGWFDCSQSNNILDIGCGSGLIAIMAAQRCDATITGIEIDKNAARQAQENVNKSPWKNRISIINKDLLLFTSNERFDTIVSNPPYFSNSLKCDNTARTMARHNDSLNNDDFFKKCKELLSENGKVSIIIPTDIMHDWQRVAYENNFYGSRITLIKTTPEKNAKRVLLEFSLNKEEEIKENTLILENSRGVYSDEAKEILRDFYLRIE
ncbi:MAG: methyltransferase [Bacteroidaceae bacterium]|nr:methyltransferase [Bacteroidaceae bacterium]